MCPPALHCQCFMLCAECRLATTNAPAMYILPDPCWAAIPTSLAVDHPITACVQFDYILGSKTRGDCSKYPGVAVDPTMCWIKVRFTDAGMSLSGWINMARTAGDVQPEDPCGSPTFTGGNANTWVGMCDNEECSAAVAGECLLRGSLKCSRL